MHLTVVVMHGARRPVLRRLAVGNSGLFMATGGCCGRRRLVRHAAGPRNERRQRRDLENDPGGRQKTQALAKCCH